MTSTVKSGITSESALRTILLYGSCARRDNTATSDIDIMIIGHERGLKAAPEPRVSLHTYSMDDLSVLAAEGDLFVLHLIKEAIAIRDPRSILTRLRARFHRPASFIERSRQRLAHASHLLNVTAELYNSDTSGFSAIARYIYRTLIYAMRADQGNPNFSLRALASECSDARRLCTADDRGWRFVDFTDIRKRVTDILTVSYTSSPASTFDDLRSRTASDPVYRGLLRRLLILHEREVYDIATR